MQILNVTNDARQTFTTTVGSQEIRLNVYYLQDDLDQGKPGWFCDFFLLSGQSETVITGCKLQTLQYIGRGVPTNFIGRIYVAPLTAPIQDLTARNPWFATHALIYATVAEVEDIIDEFALQT